MSRFRLKEYIQSWGLSTVRWIVVATVVGSVFLVDYMLKSDVSDKVSDAWNEACIQQVSVMACLERIDQYHKPCFDHSYTSMLMRFGNSRWEAFKLDIYERCMETGNRDENDPTANLFRQNEP